MSNKPFIVDGGIHALGDSVLAGDVYVDGNVILSDGSQLISDSAETKIDFARILDLNSNRLKNVGVQTHPYDLASKIALDDVISNNVTDVSQVQLDKLTSLNTLLDNPTHLTEAQTSVDEKISVADLNTKISDAVTVIEANIADALAIEYAELNSNTSSVEQEIADKQASLASMDAQYQDRVTQLHNLRNQLTTSYNRVVSTARAYMDQKIQQIIDTAPPEMDTIHEVAERLEAVTTQVTNDLTNQINAKASIEYVDNRLTAKAPALQVLSWDDANKNSFTNLEANFKIDKIFASKFRGDGSKLYGLAAAGIFTEAWERIEAMQQRLIEVQTIIGLAKTYESVTLVRTIENPATAGASNFGNAVAISGSKVIVGAYNHNDTDANFSGRVYIAEKNTGALTPIFNPNPNPDDKFGNSVAINSVGDRILIGAQGKDDEANDAGRVYFADLDGNIIKTITNPNPVAGDAYGYSVALTDTRAIVGTKYYDDVLADDAGKVHILSGTGPVSMLGIEEKVYTNPDVTFQRYFGSALSAKGNFVVVGAPSYEVSDTVSDSYRGCVTLHDMSLPGDSFLWKVDNPNWIGTTNTNDSFGYSVALANDFVVVGAPTDASTDQPVALDNSGAVYVLRKDTGAIEWHLANPNDNATSENDKFGFSVAADGDIAVVGAPGETTPGSTSYSGIAYVYNVRTGELLFTIENPDPGATAQFGYSVAIQSNTIIIGAPDTNEMRGKIYIYNMA